MSQVTGLAKGITNAVHFEGRIATDLELRATKKGKAVTSFRFAVTEKLPVNAPEGAKPTVHFFSVVAWADDAKAMVEKVGKGDKLAIEGTLRPRSFQGTKTEQKAVYHIVELHVAKWELVAKKRVQETASA